MESVAFDSILPEWISNYIRDNDLQALHVFVYHLSTNIIIPGCLAVFLLGGLLSFLQWFGRIIVPPKARVRYRDAKLKYQNGKRKEAIKEWNRLTKFGPAYLSRAVHALYVEGNPQEAMRIIRLAKEAQVTAKLYQVSRIQDDAKALQNGASKKMMELNAQLFKQEYLGIA